MVGPWQVVRAATANQRYFGLLDEKISGISMAHDSITLENMAFYGYHGSDPHESKVGGRFFVDVVLNADLSKPGRTDSLPDTVNYEKAYAIIRDHVEGKRFNLLEALGQTIADTLLHEFPQISRVSVRVRKPGVPLRGILDYTQVEIVRSRESSTK